MNSAQAQRLYDSGWTQIRNGDFTSAFKTSEVGLKNFPEVASEWHWRFRTLKAEILMRQGRYEDSLAVFQLAIPQSLSYSESAVWQKLTQGSALAYLAKHTEAQTALLQARSLAAEKQPQLEGEALLRLGTLAYLQRDLNQSQSRLNACLEFARRRRDSYLEASALGMLGLVAARIEHYDESIEWNRQALELDQANGWLGLAARAEGNIGWSHYLIGDLVNALDFYTKADKHDIEAGVPERRITWLNAAGDVYYDLRDYAAAEAKSREALTLADSLRDTDDAIYCLQNLALIAIARKQYDDAARYTDDAERREASAPDRTRELYTRLISADLVEKMGDLSRAESLYQQIVRDPAAPRSLEWEARAGLAQTHAAQGKFALAESEFQQAISTISAAQDSIQHEEFRLSFLSSAIRFYDEYVNFLLSRNRPIDALRVADRSRAQTLEHGLSFSQNKQLSPSLAADKLLPQDIARRQNASLLFYWLGPAHSFLWVVTPQNVSLLTLPPRDEIDTAAAAYRKSFLDLRDPIESQNIHGRKLYEILVRPAEKLLPKGKRVLILPDGSLNGLNFETLIAPEPQPHYWIEDRTISIANSLALLSRARTEAPPQSPYLLFFGDALAISKDFPPLADAEQEVAALLKHFPSNRTSFFMKEHATPSNYLASKPRRYAFLHFATHGTASITRPLESAIILSPDPGMHDSYKLYARDIVQQPLNAYMVSISACNGAGERVLAGEGLVGLSWAFLRAGAHNVVAGLWEVSTSSAPQIFDGMYDGISKGQDPATALRNAKLSFVHSKGPRRRPFYWAPFQLYSGS